MPKAKLLDNVPTNSHVTFGVGNEAAIIFVSSLSTAKSACFFLARWLAVYADCFAGDLEVAISRSSNGGSAYLWNRTGNQDGFFVRYFSVS